MSKRNVYSISDKWGRPEVDAYKGFDENVFAPLVPSDPNIFGASFDEGSSEELSGGEEEIVPEEEEAFAEDSEALAEEEAEEEEEREPEPPPEILEAQRLRQEAEELAVRAREALASANLEAEEVIRRARSQADKVEAAAYQAGFEQGEEAGKRLSEQKTESVVRRLESVILEMAKQQLELLRDSEEELVNLAYLISLKLIHRELQQDPSVVLDVVRAGIEKLKRASELTILVSPQDFRFIEDHIERLSAFTETGTKVNIEPLDSVSRGGCRIKSNTGEVDATIETMVRNLLDRIWGEGESDGGA